ncbi:flippase-like domain-containing protein [Weissella coleopterorum]|uniref:Phosphatidylglycerol lysyltransferase n=1 Tax=Weissella coleopterorum TaxID=2714949 RepID=A0A6G8AZE4_9LACO|nr:lysylphosphatidylglycerol synthase transmembrane domain-containing protein [Weissella coleopterorum]QIL50357.1 flippase-like domain-containing protein [Weissella coleopterorum]
MSRKNILVFVGMLLLGGLIFGWSMRHVDGQQLQTSLKLLNWGWIIVAVLAMVVYLLLEALVVKIMVDTKSDSISWANAIRVPLVEQLGNGITPFSSGGQPMQLIALAQTGLDVGRASSVLLMKFVVYQSMIVVNFLFALIVGFQFITTKLHQMTLIVVLGFLIHLVVVTLLLLVMYSPKVTHRLVELCLIPVRWVSLKHYQKWYAKILSKIDNFHAESLRMGRDIKTLVKVIIVTFIQLMFYYAIPYFILLALGQHHANLIFVMSLHILIVMVISLFPIPGGSGGAEVGFSMLFSSFLPNSGALVLAMLIWRIITYYFGLFAGIVAFSLPVKRSKI